MGDETKDNTYSVYEVKGQMLDRLKEEAARVTGKDQPSYSDVIRLLFARQRRQQGSI